LNAIHRFIGSGLVRFSAALVVVLALCASVSTALAAGGPVEAGGDQAAHGAQRLASEDGHWWLGKELPVSFREEIAAMIGPSFIDGDPASKLNVGHILFGLIAFVIGIGMALAASRKVRGAVLPPRKWGAAAFFDLITEAIMGLMTSMMPREKAVKYLPLVTAAAVFILISNLLGLLPGSVPPTQSFNTTLALGLVAFVFYNYHGIKTQGIVNYLKHFMGPMLALAPLMIVIELISHCVRPLSLGLRLMGNMFGDHQVLFIFMSFGLPLIPIPLMVLGLMVCIVQTVVFTLLFIVYVSLAVEEHDHGHEHADEHDHEHAGSAPHAHAH
jgi:F-type H+-transporting ATPase subunit a